MLFSYTAALLFMNIITLKLPFIMNSVCGLHYLSESHCSPLFMCSFSRQWSWSFRAGCRKWLPVSTFHLCPAAAQTEMIAQARSKRLVVLHAPCLKCCQGHTRLYAHRSYLLFSPVPRLCVCVCVCECFWGSNSRTCAF